MDWLIPLSDIDFGPEESRAVQDVLDRRWLTMGATTEKFEQEFAAFLGVRHAIAVVNCTAALHLACLVSGLKVGDEAIVPSLTFVATANAVRYTGATPVFADIENEANLCITPANIKACLTNKSRAVIVMHYGGYACDMPGILALAKDHGLMVIEDAAHAVGSSLEGRKLGSWGNVGCFSFFSNKNLITGEGGMLVTDNDKIAEQLYLLRSHGMTSLTWDRFRGHAWGYDVTAIGYNYRIDEIHSALGLIQLRKLNENNSKRVHLTSLYRDYLHELAPQVLLPFESASGISACHLFPILLPREVDREAFMQHMKLQGIQTSIHYRPVHSFSAYQDIFQGTLPVTDDIGGREVTLPLYPNLKDEQVEIVACAVKDALAAQG